MEERNQRQHDLILGVDRSLIEKFLLLVRENYKKADQASFFLEHHAGVNNIIAVAHMRDVLSHLVTLLDPKTPKDAKEQQLANAEEHLRRAILEPYETALAKLIIDFNSLYLKYKEYVLPLKDRYPTLKNAPDHERIEAELQDIKALNQSGRSAKGKNLWDEAWEEGVDNFIDAYTKLSALHSEVTEYWDNYKQIGLDRKNSLLAIWGTIATIMTAILAIILTILLAKK
jgi:hypothetical protein